MSAEDDLRKLRQALQRWRDSKTYEEGCRNWRAICLLIGETPPDEPKRAA